MKLKIGDFVISGAVLTTAFFIAAIFLKAPNGTITAVITEDGNIVKRITLNELSEPLEFSIDNRYHNHIRAEKGRISFTEADCPDKTCVRTGWIDKPGQVSACLPNGVLIKLEGKTDDIDAYLH